jgi:Family of unknown function (DUF6459)
VEMRSIGRARQPLGVRGVPQSDPPFDDELDAQVWAPMRQPALDWPSRRGPGRPTDRPAARPGGASAFAGASGDAHLAVRRFVRMCVEVLNGYRPATHLRRLTLPREAQVVVAQGVAGARRVAELRRAVARHGDRRGRRPGPVGVLRLRLCEPRSGAVEAAVLLLTGERTWAMALRLELHQRAWAATALRLI